jgi:hypothetical protein
MAPRVGFSIRSRDGIEYAKPEHKSVGSVLSLAIQRALQHERDGAWTVLLDQHVELYRVRKEEGIISVLDLRAFPVEIQKAMA